MIKNLKKRQEGFTIIEVMIVLVIAAVILLIVFLAIPALQRNSRNTQRKNDVAAATAAMSEYSNNNSGGVGKIACGTANPYSINGGTCSAPVGTVAEFKLGYYTAAPTVTTTNVAAVPSPVPDTLTIVTGAKCNANGTTTSSGASSRAVAAVYGIESGGNLVLACQES